MRDTYAMMPKNNNIWKFSKCLKLYMAPATAIADGKAQRAFADCRRQKQTGKNSHKIPIKLSKLNDFYDIKNHYFQMTQNYICK